MEADTKDVCAIQDEDILRRMWQQTEDFGRKKEIRAHMYKLREARLKEFYTSGEVLKDVQRSNSSPGLRDQHSKNPQWAEGPTHADSLADHSFLSLKSKEIRDSESPTREIQYRNSKNRSDDGAWTITANVEKSEDGKTLKSSRIATTQGSRPLDGGELAFAAKNEQHSSVYSDGDANNFTKCVGESSKTHAQQELTVGDDKNYRTSKSTTSSSSSKVVSHHTSMSGNTDDFNKIESSTNKNIIDKSLINQSQIGDEITTTRTVYTSEIPVSKSQNRDGSTILTSNDGTTTTTRKVYSSEIPVSRSDTDRSCTTTRTVYNSEIPVSKTHGSTTITSNVYSSDIPDDLKKNIIDGNTKVITETKTLPDGSTVTTTRYETKGSKKWSSTSGSSQAVSNRQVVEQKSSSTTDNKQIEYGDNNKAHHTVTVSKTIRDGRPNQEDYPDNISKVESTRFIQSERNVDDRINKVHVTQENVDHRNVVHEDIRRENITRQEQINNKQDTRDDRLSNKTVKVTKTIHRNDEREDCLQLKPVPDSEETHTTVTTKTTIHSGVTDGKQVNRSEVLKKHDSLNQTTRVDESVLRENILVSAQPQDKLPQQKPHEEVLFRPLESRPKEQEPARPQDIELTKSCKPPTDPYKASSPTSDQYSTTYRQEFTNKRISVDISPTHNAFASSLRAVSPDRISDRTKSRTSLRNSSSSLRNSTSPDKNTRPDIQKHLTRGSPERKPTVSSPERKRVGSPRKEYSPERYDKSPNKSSDITKSQSPERKSPDRKPSRELIVKTTHTKVVNGRQPVDSNTLTKKKHDDRKSPEKIDTRNTKTTYDYSPVRTPSPTKPRDHISPTKTTETITTKITRNQTSPERPNSIRATSPTKYIDRSSPVRSPTKTSDTTFNSDTITRKKKIPENEKPIDHSNPIRSSTKATEVITTTNTGTITKKKSPTDESPRDKSPTKPFDRESPVRSRPTEVNDKNKPSSRDSSPTCSTSDIEFISTIVTDLDEPFDHSTDKRPTSLDITVVSTEKTTDVIDKLLTSTSPKRGSPVKESPKSKTPKTSPVKETPAKLKSSPVKEVPKRNSFQPTAPDLDSPSERPPSKFPVEEEPFDVVCEVPVDKEPKERPPLKRTETYEDRCRKMLGLTSETPLVDAYIGREPVEEPLIVKTHYDYGCREDELIHSHVEKISKYHPNVKPTVDSTDFINTEIHEIESTPVNKKSVTKELASPNKLQEKKPTQKIYAPERKSPEKRPPEKKSPERKSPEKLTTDKKSPVKINPERISPEKLSPEKKKPKDREPDDREYITEYTDEYCERPVSNKPTHQKIPTQTTATVTETTTNKKPVHESPDQIQRKPIQEQPQKNSPKKSEIGDYSTEYTDEYGEISPQDRNSPRHTIDRKISKENITSTITRIEKKVDKKPSRESPDKKRGKSPKKQLLKKEEIDSEDDIEVCTMEIEQKSVEKKPMDKYQETTRVDKTIIVTNENTIRPKQSQPIETETKDVPTKSVLKKPKEFEPSHHSPNKPTIITDLTDEYYITDKVVSNSHTTNTNTFINQEKYDSDISLVKSPRDSPEREQKIPRDSISRRIPQLEDEHSQEPHIRTHRIDTTVITETEERATSPRRQPQKALPADTMECIFTTTVTTNDDEEVYPIRRPTKPEDKPKARKPEDRNSPIKQIKDDKKDTKITTASKVITKKSLSTEIDTKRKVTVESSKRKSPTEKSPKEKSPVRHECPRQRSPSPYQVTAKKVVETDRATSQIIRKISNKDLIIKKTDSKGKIIDQPKRLPAESPNRKPLYTSPAASPERKPTTKSKTTEPAKKHVVTKTISLAGPKPSTPGKTSPKTIAIIKTKISPTTITKTVKTTKTANKTVKQHMYTSDSDSEPEYTVKDDTNVTTCDIKKRVVTTANIKMSPTARKEPSPNSNKPDISAPSFKVNESEIIITTTKEPVEPVSQKITKKHKLTTKCVTTKTIILNENVTDDQEIIIDLQRSTSSREQSPEKMCPVPVSSEDESGYPRYPDQINEPDDIPRRRPQRVTDIPLTEEEDVNDFNRITEITRKPITRISDIDKVHETDESLLSVTEKVSRFITSAEKTTEDDRHRKPAPKVPRPELVVSEELEDDECLLSVSDKVTKFISTAEQISVKKTERPVSPAIRKSEGPTLVSKPTYHETKVDENDECLRSVTEKVTHFIQAADTVKQKPTSKEPASKVARPEFTDLDETLRTDECLLSVSDKVTKFLTTAEKVASEVKILKSEPKENVPQRQPSPEKTKPDKLRQSPVRQSPVKRTPEPKKSPAREVVSQELTKPKSELVPQAQTRPKSESVPQESTRPKSEPIKLTETKTLKSSEAVRKAKALFENIAKPQENPKQRDILSRPSVWEGRKKSEPKPTVDEPDVKLTDIGVYKKKEPITTMPEIRKKLTYDDEEDTCKRISKDITLKSTKLIINDKKVNKSSSTERQDIHRPKTVSPERELSGYLKPTNKSNSTKREEVTVENITQRTRHLSPEPEIPGYMRPISKTSPEDRDKYIMETRTRPSYSPDRETVKKSVVEHEEFDIETKYVHKSKYENGDVPGYMRPLQRYQSPEREYICRNPKDDEEIIVETTIPKARPTSPDRDVPGYMRPLQRHAHSPSRELDRRDSAGKNIPLTDEDTPRAGKKFGVVLRRTDSGRVITTGSTTTTSSTVTERRRSSVPGYPVIEEIQDLDVLEKILDKVVGYEQRRRIRAQIRIVKRLISENKIQYTANSTEKKKITTTKHSSPVREPHPDRKSPSKEIKRPTSPVKRTENKRSTYEKEEYKSSSYTRNESTRERSMSPDVKKKSPTTSSVYKTDLKPSHVPSKSVNENQPSWVTNRNLKKTETVVTEDRRTVPMKKKETPRRSPSPQKETRPIDCITSSYGIGPTDENGQPLFGIRALRKAAAADKVQVRGTVVTSQFYSENGQEPVGEVTVTKYSNNPKELNVDDEHISSKAKGFASVTTTQKFGTRGTPSLKNIVDKKKTITDKHIDEDEIFKTTSTKVTRRGSVKALSQKFIENAVEISRNERQTYPKAGLILRTSSFKDSTSTDKSSSRESSPGFQGKISLESITSDSHKTTTTSSTTTTSHRQQQQQQQVTDETKTFLNSHTRVANAQDVITRMKNAEREDIEGDTAEDREARMLLNKFLGAQVLMSGMEPLLKPQSGGQSNGAHQLVRKVQKTKTVTSSTKDSTSKPIALSKRFQCPITPEVLEDIWDEQSLRLLLEQCTDYEERRVIRARLRQVMAEQEAVANVVASAVADRDTDADRTGSLQERIETTKKTYSEGPVTTTQVSTRVISSSTRQQVNKPISPFAKFRQLDKQNSLNSPPSSPRTPVGGGSGAPLFKFTDPALSQSASTVKDRLLHWCQMKTKEYQNIKLSNFSACWADGMAFCALIHHFLPDAFDYHVLTPQQRRHNFTLAFTVADEQAGIAPLLDVDDMVAMRRPDWKCVFTYVQSIYRRFKDED